MQVLLFFIVFCPRPAEVGQVKFSTVTFSWKGCTTFSTSLWNIFPISEAVFNDYFELSSYLCNLHHIQFLLILGNFWYGNSSIIIINAKGLYLEIGKKRLVQGDWMLVVNDVDLWREAEKQHRQEGESTARACWYCCWRWDIPNNPPSIL